MPSVPVRSRKRSAASRDEVEPAVAVDVGEGRPGAARPVERDAGRRADLLERAVAAVAEEQVGADVAAHDVEVDPAVAVVVAGGHAAGLGLGGLQIGDLDVAVRVDEPGLLR